MEQHTQNRISGCFRMIMAAILSFLLSLTSIAPVFAGYFSVSPMNQLITLTPGETYVGNFDIVNPGDSEYDFYYKLRVEPFSVDENNNYSLVASENDYNQIVDWIELTKTEGVVAPNNSEEVRFSIHVPEDAPAGGQYATIVVSSDEHRVDNTTVDLREIYESAHLIYADVVGETVRKGEITDVTVPSFMFNGKISGSAKIKNLGNVHSGGKATLQVFPLFSKEEIYTNEEEPKTFLVMPNSSVLTNIEWEETPNMGIFHVVYNVEYEGVKSNVDKYVIICPIWLLIIIIAVLVLLILAVVFGTKRKK